MSKSWKENLLKSSLPLEYETSLILNANRILVNGEYSYARPNENGVVTDFSIDIHAKDYFHLTKETIWAEIQYIIECKYCHEGVNWLFYPGVDPVDGHGFLEPYDQLRAYTLESEYLDKFDRERPYAIKGLELVPDGSNPNTILRGLEQLRHGAANVTFETMKDSFENSIDNQYPIQIFAPILVTTAKLLVLKERVKIENIKESSEIGEISKEVNSLMIIPQHSLSFEKFFDDLKRQHLKPYEKQMTNLYQVIAQAKKSDLMEQAMYRAYAEHTLPMACERILIVQLNHLDKMLKTIHRRIQTSKKDLKRFGKIKTSRALKNPENMVLVHAAERDRAGSYFVPCHFRFLAVSDS